MYHNYFFLKRLASELNKKLNNAILQECFSQQKDELILGFSLQDQKEFYFKATLDSDVNLISFRDEFHRARKNSVDLFDGLIGRKVMAIKVTQYDRSFRTEFDDGSVLLFKLHGNRSNIILMKGDENILFKNKLRKDEQLRLQDISKQLEVAIDCSDENHNQLEKVAGKEIAEYLEEQKNYSSLPLSDRKSALVSIINLIESEKIKLDNSKRPTLTLLPASGTEFESAVEAANALYKQLVTGYLLNREKSRLINKIEQKARQSQNYILKSKMKLREVENRRSYEEIANIIMANLHQISPGIKKVELFDFYRNEQIELKLKKDLTPQKNAEQYYRKAKNEKIEIRKLKENIEQKQRKVEFLVTEIEEIRATGQYKDLRKKATELLDDLEAEARHLPYRRFEHEGYEIRVGKSAAQNDELTLRHTRKHDLWLHARDVAGSHVVIRTDKNKSVPKTVIEYAAGLAAHYSKRKNDSLCPVIVTPRKYIRKGKNLPPGKVIVEKEEVVMVQPITP